MCDPLAVIDLALQLGALVKGFIDADKAFRDAMVGLPKSLESCVELVKAIKSFSSLEATATLQHFNDELSEAKVLLTKWNAKLAGSNKMMNLYRSKSRISKMRDINLAVREYRERLMHLVQVEQLRSADASRLALEKSSFTGDRMLSELRKGTFRNYSVIEQEEARSFWIREFPGHSEVEWSQFRTVIRWLPLVRDSGERSRKRVQYWLREELDENHDGKISIYEWNAWTSDVANFETKLKAFFEKPIPQEEAPSAPPRKAAPTPPSLSPRQRAAPSPPVSPRRPAPVSPPTQRAPVPPPSRSDSGSVGNRSDEDFCIRPEDVSREERLGSGFSGQVFKGFWRKTTRVAIKVLHDAEPSADFMREAQFLYRMRHPNVVSFFGLVMPTDKSEMQLITELVQGGSLIDWLRSDQTWTSYSSMVVLPGIAKQICAGMEYIGSKGIVHRDLAARNVLVADKVGDEVLCKICDLGLSRLLSEGVYSTGSTGSGRKVALPFKWTAPEAFDRKIFSTASDVWSFGVLLWECWSLGQEPWNGLDLRTVRQKVKAGERLERPDDCPSSLYDKIMLPSWNADPALRPSWHEMFEILTEVASNGDEYGTDAINEDGGELGYVGYESPSGGDLHYKPMLYDAGGRTKYTFPTTSKDSDVAGTSVLLKPKKAAPAATPPGPGASVLIRGPSRASTPLKLDIVILADCSHTMKDKFQFLSKNLRSLISGFLERLGSSVTTRVSFVGYRDHGDAEQYVVIPFTNDIALVADELLQIDCEAGAEDADVAEDVFGGLQRVLSLPWSSGPGCVRWLLHTGAAPGHGLNYHNFAERTKPPSWTDEPAVWDRFPKYDADGVIGKKLMERLVSLDIFYAFFQVYAHTEKMTQRLKLDYDTFGKQKKMALEILPIENLFMIVNKVSKTK